ncbi:MAG: hypothetical protein NTX65_13030 [Ignavibacteriales bacterium]|nr:hypothetical protein [Ignavibacteriales bacterium]
MKNKTANSLVVVFGIMLFSAPNWIAEKSVAAGTNNLLELSGMIVIFGAILILFAIINITSIIFYKSFDVNVTPYK